MAFPLVRIGPKPRRGTRVLEKELAAARALAHERIVKAAVRARDQRCRWPEKHKCRGGLECAHVIDASLGGAMAEWNLVLVCGWVHRRGPESIHGKQLKVLLETTEPLFSFWRQGEDGQYYVIAREIAPHRVERD